MVWKRKFLFKFYLMIKNRILYYSFLSFNVDVLKVMVRLVKIILGGVIYFKVWI